MTSIPIRWKNPGDKKAMAREVNAAYKRLLLMTADDTGGPTSPEALVAEETADAMAAEFERIHGVSYHHYA